MQLSDAPTPVSLPTATSSRRRFLLVAAVLYVLWLVVYEGAVGPDGRLDVWLMVNIAHAGAGLLRAFGFAASAEVNSALVRIDGLPAVLVGTACDGLSLYALFSGFILAFPGPWRHRLWFIPLGVASLYLLNVVRVAALTLNHHYAHSSVDFNHHYTFTFIVYGCICGLWAWWVRRFGPPVLAEAA